MVNSLSKLSQALTVALALNTCTPHQPAEDSRMATTEVRTSVGEALAQIGTHKQGIQAGANPDMIYSVSCGEGLIEDQTRTDVRIDAMTQLRIFVCPDDAEAYVPIVPSKGGQFGDTVCEQVMTPRTVVCDGQEKTLADPK